MRHPLKVLLLVFLFGALGAGVALYLQGQSGGGGERVSVYSAHSQDVIDALAARFTAETGIEVDVVKLGSGEVIQRVLAERKAPQCDVIWSIAGDQLEGHPEVLDPWRPKAFEAVEPAYRQAVGESPWLPYTVIVPVFLVGKGEGPRPTRWDQLGDAALKDQLSSARADKSGSAFMQLVAVLRLHGEEKGWPIVDALLGNAVLSGSSSAVPRLVNDGEARVGITLEDSARRYVKGGGPVELVYPEDGTLTAPDGLALVKGAPHPEAAKRFVEWALSKPVQEALVKEMGRRSVRSDVAPPEGLPPLKEISAQPYDFRWAAERKETLLKRWRERVAALGK
ncbi:MAG TPA: ABC transporter substrate-binding protein [Planctomycetes bacterium]|nr:ABC transporter substrate-binding protein [Planctomycetota bacterium]